MSECINNYKKITLNDRIQKKLSIDGFSRIFPLFRSSKNRRPSWFINAVLSQSLNCSMVFLLNIWPWKGTLSFCLLNVLQTRINSMITFCQNDYELNEVLSTSTIWVVQVEDVFAKKPQMSRSLSSNLSMLIFSSYNLFQKLGWTNEETGTNWRWGFSGSIVRIFSKKTLLFLTGHPQHNLKISYAKIGGKNTK